MAKMKGFWLILTRILRKEHKNQAESRYLGYILVQKLINNHTRAQTGKKGRSNDRNRAGNLGRHWADVLRTG